MCLLITSLALSLDDERPLFLTLHSPRGGGMLPGSPLSCRLTYTSSTLENWVVGLLQGIPGGLLSEGTSEGVKRLGIPSVAW